MKATVDINVTVKCNKCGGVLTYDESKDNYGDPVLNVDPCEDCKDEAYEKGVADTIEEPGI